jgi:hypothetical protein
MKQLLISGRLRKCAMTLYCSFGRKRHEHLTFTEAAECKKFWHTHAHPRQVEQLIRLGYQADEAILLSREEAQLAIETLLDAYAEAARNSMRGATVTYSDGRTEIF